VVGKRPPVRVRNRPPVGARHAIGRSRS
jgi:hypothetical protein